MPLSKKRKLKRAKSEHMLIHFDETTHSTKKYPTRSKGRYGIRLDRNGAPTHLCTNTYPTHIKIGRRTSLSETLKTLHDLGVGVKRNAA